MEFYKKSKPFEQRLHEANNICAKYIDRKPLIIEYGNETKKCLVPLEMTVSELQYHLRKGIRMKSNEATFLMATNPNIILSQNMNISSLYSQYKDKDNFLYLNLSKESTFG